MMLKTTCALIAAFAVSNTNAQATENFMVSVTIPVSVPLEVAAGQSFSEAAANFVERNKLAPENVATIESALATRWAEMQQDNLKRNQCTTWQLQYGVHPLKDWGTLPMETRSEWIKFDCDSYVPAEPPVALVSLDVVVGDTTLVLSAFPGDTIVSSVERFTQAHGINFEEHGQVLVDALTRKVEDEVQAREAAAASFLFSIPINVDGKLVRLRVHEGDSIDKLVSTFCAENGVDEASAGPVIRKAILDTTEELKQQLQEEQKEVAKKAIEEESEPKLLLDIPITVDGKDFSMKLYDGDYVDVKIASFCEMHGLDKEAHGQMLLQHITERTQALQN